MPNKEKEQIGFHYLLREIQLCTLIFFGNECIPQEVINKFIVFIS